MKWGYNVCALGALMILMCACSQEGSHKNSSDETVISHYEHLKELEWFVGNWVDQDDDVEMTTVNTWDSTKNFITQRFKLKVSGQEQLDGQQIIGWDPGEKKIHSWIFDSDGGFGESVWSQEGTNTWYANTTFTLSDGRKASATHVYTKLNDNSYTFSSESREVDGQLLPNVEAFKVVRVK